ncbi:MAG: DUF2894 domain-containing protein [Pseudomonadota bacterium]
MIDKRSTLPDLLAALGESGAGGFDPARWQYITSLARKAGEKQDAVRSRIEKIALDAIEDYRNRFEGERAKAATMMARAVSEYPDATQRLQRLFAEGNFNGIRVLAERYRRPHQSTLGALTDRINSGSAVSEKEKTSFSFDDLLRRQEAEVLQSVDTAFVHEDTPPCRDKAAPSPFHFWKKSWAKLNSDRLVTRAIKDRPEIAGPLNPQMLVTHSLSIMRQLSPDYLNRFVSYVDTLLWLTQAGEEIKSRSDKKRGRHK